MNIYLGVSADCAADGGGVTCNHTPVHQGCCELRGSVHVHLFEGCTVVVQTWTDTQRSQLLLEKQTHTQSVVVLQRGEEEYELLQLLDKCKEIR